jgi:hypothetical protein
VRMLGGGGGRDGGVVVGGVVCADSLCMFGLRGDGLDGSRASCDYCIGLRRTSFNSYVQFS